ncbi:hypothetical protein BU17DRAFT_65142 [Hysterangium stoloniferum]|nr:hypothetical protein BU17DRAFT_65142 [Hysterangium stoloniferum]
MHACTALYSNKGFQNVWAESKSQVHIEWGPGSGGFSGCNSTLPLRLKSHGGPVKVIWMHEEQHHQCEEAEKKAQEEEEELEREYQAAVAMEKEEEGRGRGSKKGRGG